MLCQNCGKNDAVVHLRRIINGESAELHLCSDCGAAMGYSIGFSHFGLGPGGIFGGMFSDLLSGGTGMRNSVCEKCGCSFDDIVRNGSVGCDECYNFFTDLCTISEIKSLSQRLEVAIMLKNKMLQLKAIIALKYLMMN